MAYKSLLSHWWFMTTFSQYFEGIRGHFFFRDGSMIFANVCVCTFLVGFEMRLLYIHLAFSVIIQNISSFAKVCSYRVFFVVQCLRDTKGEPTIYSSFFFVFFFTRWCQCLFLFIIIIIICSGWLFLLFSYFSLH